MIERKPLWPPLPPDDAQANLAERQIRVVHDHQQLRAAQP